MRSALFLALLSAFACAAPPLRDAAHGAVWGYVSLRPKDGASASADAYSDRRLRDVRAVDYSHLTFAVVYADGAAPAPALRTLTLESGPHGKRWQPPYAAAGLGDRIAIENHTDATQIVSAPAAARVFTLAPGESAQLAPPQPGELELHVLRSGGPPALVWVAAGAFAVADASGRYELDGLTPGAVELRAWHPRLPPSAPHGVTLRAGEVVRIDVAIGVDLAERGAP